ncbi:GATOR complex protein DEPDC5-like isoform X1 [Hydractinia symbiolongicarpus]|uniref:GATOR complex protein DEPDC5-like isoform X1 n=1 Tax=Hydractinia symbiolongicarpus TaxID=13093 RepID=UPI00254A3238|nr:GATOR complex protein DEPDC5-like isoform X1 [Hydractinia symbiolongicarpus]XP_057295819.1 GATOR complex protein DEPDC5-like isoform X1 [Hydractinia symbiolongicarpus]
MSVLKQNLWKLVVHQKTFSNDNVIIHKECPDLKVGDIIEVYHPDEHYSRLLVEIRTLNSATSTQQKGSVSIETSLATSFQLRQFNDVIVNKVNTNDVTLDMLELVFKDHFVTRSDCWRLHQSLIGSCVYYCNKVTFVNMRVHVNEMWMKGDKVACGVVGDSTKIVYRSKSAKFHIFVQMSSEMWDFDYFGDLYFEKAIMGFLQDLFNKWKVKGLDCNHQVVIVLFSRTYYDVNSIDEFSKEMQREVSCSRDGRFYQDFYKIIRQSEKQDNLQNVILDLKRSFHGYPHYVGCQQPLTDDRKDKVSPKGLGRNSRASEGNLLEAINLSLTVFEKHYIDCNLEETNCTTLIITPSTGVFEVDEELTILTRNRLIENGVGIDLVCLAERPLHAVPLLKFFPSKDSPQRMTMYNVPQWINLSYYSKTQASTSVFVPRMQVPPQPPLKEIYLQCSAANNITDADYEAFDANVFDYSKPKSKSLTPHLSTRQTTLLEYASVQSSPEVSKSVSNPVLKKMSLQENGNIHQLIRSLSDDPGRMAIHGSFEDLKFTMGSDKEDNSKLSSEHLQTQMSEQSVVKNLTLNPFKPQSMAVAITLFKYRWLHLFPMGMKGKKMQSQTKSSVLDVVDAPRKAFTTSESDVDSHESDIGAVSNNNSLSNGVDSVSSSVSNEKENIKSKRKLAVEEIDWISNVTQGVDWKSLCMPACLPLTLNYFPDETSLRSVYFEYHYTMVIEDLPDIELEIQKEVGRFDRSFLPPDKKFLEMLSQRIAQGFQVVTNPDIVRILKLENSALQSMKFDPKKDYVLSMGLTIHHLKLVDTEVHVTRYSLHEPVTAKPFLYRYNVWPHNCLQYSVAATEFQYEAAVKYNWNNLDRYICETEKDFSQLNEHMKYWRTRFLLLPVRSTPFAPREVDGMLQIEGFLRFLEGMNKIKRGTQNRQLFFSRAATVSRKVSTDKSKSERVSSITPEKSDRKELRVSNDKRTSPMPIDNHDTSRDADTSLTRTPSTPLSGVPDDMPPEHSLSITSPLQDIVQAMLNPKYGLYFLPKQDNLCNNTFISAEAVAWMIKSIDGCHGKHDAVSLGQRLLQGKFIMHASESLWQNFIDGFYLYYIKEEKKDEDVEKRRFWFARKTEEELLTSYNIQWLEVAVWRDDNEDQTACFLLDELPTPDFVYAKNQRYQTANKEKSVPLFKSMEYNLDADSKSARSEWCVISYHGNYHPNKCAYAIEMDWMVATGSIIAELVQKWSHKATSCGVHIVPAPMCAFPGSSIRCNRNPFRKSPFIHLNVDSLLKEGQLNLFEEFDPKTWSRRMFLFQEAILQKFDFLRDIPQTAPESPLHPGGRARHYQYIHASGSILMKVNDAVFGKDSLSPTFDENDIKESPFRKNRRPSKKPFEAQKNQLHIDEEYKDVHGFFWVYNYALSKKWRTNVTGDVAAAKKYVATFSDFCANRDDQLLQFWNEARTHTTRHHGSDTPGTL